MLFILSCQLIVIPLVGRASCPPLFYLSHLKKENLISFIFLWHIWAGVSPAPQEYLVIPTRVFS